ncbi:GNAT family N-acetyltransferase [Amphibacillus sp. Q70]|uniref:GNAT family N-acetyltransferase n=1 Tax=Amphibacillus sp. Q70 TaxID=3453416 RepID=UPI003F8354F4
MVVRLNECTINDLTKLQEISTETFSDTFKDQNTEKNLKAYLKSAYNLQQLKKELSSPNAIFYFLLDDNRIVGYIKLNTASAQTETVIENALEIERIYIRKQHKRNGYGKYLIKKVEQIASNLGKTTIWLGVWEYNTNAIAFYEKIGFNIIDSHPFFMGTEEQLDLIMAKKIDS